MSVRLAVRVTPKGGRDAVDGWSPDEAGRPVLKVRVSAAPSDGAANAAVVALIAKALNVPRSAVRIAAGETSRLKRLEVEGATAADLAQAFGAPP
ncbi:DUF167 family protein [Phenylobacterium sp.]|uniref:DUF167 domain-containing protein n=1 Tax=Phenylobacterium sp. TaxID=1871053 RepID=UPI002811A697|nr:DUF167 family protein [Phenylobacterium sp.]